VAQAPRTVTALRARSRGRVAVELDGAPWRTLPLEPVVRAGLEQGEPLDRPRARTLARELRRARALTAAGRALRRRDLSVRGLDVRLERAGVAPAGRRETLVTLQSAGLVDDARYATARAATLAERGYGDAAIRWDLERRGIDGERADAAVAALEPEAERARRVAEGRGGGVAALALLARRGFGEETVEAVRDAVGADEAGSVG
jgi:SOS response regulatory protein OraA/RecX